MKRLFVLLILALFCFSSCSKSKNEKKEQLVVFAATSLTESLTEIGKNYEKENPNVNVLFNFDSSGKLRTEIIEGAECDVFISASPSQMNDIEKGKNIKNYDFVDSSTRANFLQNQVVLAVNDKNTKNIKSFNDLISHLQGGDVLLAIGNSDVPVGGYTKKIFEYFNLNEDEMNKKSVLTYGSNVKEVTTAVKESIADAGIIYSTDAFSASLNVVDSATKEMCGDIVYPICILKNAHNRKRAENFVSYLKTTNAKKEFEKVGFVSLI